MAGNGALCLDIAYLPCRCVMIGFNAVLIASQARSFLPTGKYKNQKQTTWTIRGRVGVAESNSSLIAWGCSAAGLGWLYSAAPALFSQRNQISRAGGRQCRTC